MIDLDEIEARANAAAKGPWKFPHRDYPGVVTSHLGCLWNPETGEINDPSDAEFIAHAREDVPALVAEVKRLRRELECAQTALTEAFDEADAEAGRAREALQAVREIHRPEWARDGGHGGQVCSTCLAYTSPMPQRIDWPCPTIRALDAALDGAGQENQQ